MSGPPTESYGAAVRELEAILAELEHDHVDLDVLGARVRRAAELIRFCRARIDQARVEVTAIVNAIANDERAGHEASGPGDAGQDGAKGGAPGAPPG